MSQDLINRAVRGLKRCGPFYYRPGDEPHPLDRSLAGRVKHVFLCGMTRAIQICRDAGEDPDYEEPRLSTGANAKSGSVTTASGTD